MPEDQTIAVTRKVRLAVVSPLLDKRHGTERRVVEWISRLAEEFEIHIYSQEVDDVDLSKVTWHRIPKLLGPHLFNFLWWFVANQIFRQWHRRFRHLSYDIVFSPGCNCLDAEVVSVHIVFAEYVRKIGPALRFGLNRARMWPHLLHRKIYYRIVILLEHLIYTRPRVKLIVMARKTAAELQEFYKRQDASPVLYPGLEHRVFNTERRAALREESRAALGLLPERFYVILVGNDWRNKGAPALIEALVQLEDAAVDLLLVSRENPADARAMALKKGVEHRVRFLPPRSDVEFYYAAGDAYTGPSLEDMGPLPPFEAMACGLPVIVSATAGVSEIITHGVNGMILEDPTDATALAAMIRRLCEDTAFREQLGRNAAAKAREFTWERNVQEMATIFEEIMSQKAGRALAANHSAK